MLYILHKLLKYTVGIIIFFSLVSCSLLSPVKSPANTYRLEAVPQVSVKKSSTNKSVLVTRSPTSYIFNTNRIAYSLYPYHIAYFAKNAWADAPDRMLQTALTLTLQNTHYFKNVSSSLVGRYQYVVNTQLIELQQNFTCGSSWISLIYRVQITNSSNHIIATRIFKIREPVTCNTPYGGVLAANKAASRLLRAVSLFVIKHIP